jgi:hypothetical protein
MGSKDVKRKEMNPILSILICTVYGRESYLARALGELTDKYQIISETITGNKSHLLLSAHGAHVEILINKDNKEISVGAKRQQLLKDSEGNWIVFFDDDDKPYEGYITKVVQAIQSNTDADCIGIHGDMTTDGKHPQTWIHSIKYRRWASKQDGYDWVRPPIHFNPVKRIHAIKTGFKDLRFAEDHDYSIRLRPLLKKETFIKEKLFLYAYQTGQNHNEKYGVTPVRSN